MLATCCRHVPVCCARCGIMALQKRRWRTSSEQQLLWWRRYCTVLQHGPAFDRVKLDAFLRRCTSGYCELSVPIQWLNCLLTLVDEWWRILFAYRLLPGMLTIRPQVPPQGLSVQPQGQAKAKAGRTMPIISL